MNKGIKKMINGKIKNILVPCNKSFYDIDRALFELNEIHYRQYIDVQPGAIAYIYVGAPFEQAIMYACKVIAVNETENLINDDKYARDPYALNNVAEHYMRLRLICKFNPNLFTYKKLKENGLKTCMQGQCFVPDELQKYIDLL